MSPPGETFVPVQANAFHTAFVSACICASIRLTGRSFTLPNVYILNRHIDYSNSRFLIQRYEARFACSRFRSVLKRPADQAGSSDRGAANLSEISVPRIVLGSIRKHQLDEAEDDGEVITQGVQEYVVDRRTGRNSHVTRLSGTAFNE